mmetsp:Transcript_44643/g.105890  ORF Transcript_44643/g.105890 Transcript_44643/m.105890 type:complete len:239 (-) Transcript_44643:122-838(-)
MPVFLMLECVCDETSFGDQLLVVGNSQQLGNWDADHGLVLTTSASMFPRWVLPSPMLLALDPEDLPYTSLEYKYVIRDSSGCLRWEDFGLLDMPIFSSSASAAANLRVMEHSRERPINRRLMCWKTLRELKLHGAAVRIDRFQSYSPDAEDACCAPMCWRPDRAGCDGGELRAREGQVLCALERSLLVFRSLLLGVLLQLVRRHWMPGHLWQLVSEYVGHEAPARVLPVAKLQAVACA